MIFTCWQAIYGLSETTCAAFLSAEDDTFEHMCNTVGKATSHIEVRRMHITKYFARCVLIFSQAERTSRGTRYKACNLIKHNLNEVNLFDAVMYDERLK